MQKIALLLAIVLFNSNGFGQTTFEGKVVSIIDSTPLRKFHFRLDNNKMIETDSTGSFKVVTSKKRIKLSTIFPVYSFDTILYPKSSTKNITLYTINIYDSMLANYDIKHHKLRLFCGISFAPLASTKEDKEFEKMFRVDYFIVGDFLPSSKEQMTSYNKVIFEYLDKEYSKDWRLKVRKDIVGL